MWLTIAPPAADAFRQPESWGQPTRAGDERVLGFPQRNYEPGDNTEDIVDCCTAFLFCSAMAVDRATFFEPKLQQVRLANAAQKGV
jgi:hypothetical protein